MTGTTEPGLGKLSAPCVHCGLCLPACPTYSVTHDEVESPRGRILLLEAWGEGRVTADDVRPHLDRCIGCLACESMCPSGVPYAALLESGRAALGGPPFFWRVFLRHLLKRRWLVGAAAGLARLVRRVPPKEHRRPAFALRATARAGPSACSELVPTQPRARVGIHLGCVTPALFPRLAGDVALVLAKLGYLVEVPRRQGCCGALARHAGLAQEADLAPFAGCDFVVSAAAGCSATPGLTDVTRLLLDETEFAGARHMPLRVAYDAPCHLVHAQGVDAGPVLDRIPGITRVALPDDEDCCGAGGLYMQREPELARAVRARKLDALLESGAEAVATPNPGCMLWLWQGLRQRGANVRVVHPVTLLAEAWDAG